MKNLKIVGVITIIIYVLCSFIEFNFNPANWHMLSTLDYRVGFLYTYAVITSLIFVFYRAFTD